MCQTRTGRTSRRPSWWASRVTLLFCLSKSPWPDEAEEATHQREAGAHVHDHQLYPRPRAHTRVLPCRIDDVAVLDDGDETCYSGETATLMCCVSIPILKGWSLDWNTYRAPKQNKPMTRVFCRFFICSLRTWTAGRTTTATSWKTPTIAPIPLGYVAAMQYPGLISLFQVYSTGLHVNMANISMANPETVMKLTTAHAAAWKPLDGKIPR